MGSIVLTVAKPLRQLFKPPEEPRRSLMPADVVVADEARCALGEGPVWDPIRGQLLWIDILGGVIHVGALRADRSIKRIESMRPRSGGTITAVAVAESGAWIIAEQDGVAIRHPNGWFERGARLLPPDGSRRLNDGKPDPAGRFLVGSLCQLGSSKTEELFRIEEDGGVLVVDDDLTLSNGLAWAPDGRTMYSVDTGSGSIMARHYDPATGVMGSRCTHVQIESGSPDGICIDSQGHLWVAIWGAGAVHRYSPDGTLNHVIHVPAPHTSSVAFAGPDLDTLFITTATQDLTAEQQAAYPLSGCLFAATPGVRGLAPAMWNGILPSNPPTKRTP
jgi:sugar lactone lactonase YvrE